MDRWRCGLIALAVAAVAWPSVAIAQNAGSGRFSIDAQWTIASTPSSPYAGTLRFTVAGTATKTPYGTISLSYTTPVVVGSLSSAPNGCIAPSASLQTLSNGAPRVGIIAELDPTGSKVLLRFSVRYNWNLQCPDGSSSLLAGYEAVGACLTSSPCATSAPAELPRIAPDIYQLDSTGPNRVNTTLTLHARVSLVPFTPITSKLVNPNPALIDSLGQLNATAASVAPLTLDPKAAAIGAVADGVSKLLVVVDTKDPVTLALSTGQPPAGLLTSLDGGPTVNMTPVRVAGGGAERNLVVAVYTPPAYFGAPSAAAERSVAIAIAAADQTVTQPIVLARPPLVFVHGLAAAPGAWQLFREQLAARGYPDTLNARRVWMTAIAVNALQELSPTLANVNVQAIGGDIDHALASYRVRGITAAQVDLVAHGIGGLIARGYERTLRRYAARDNYAAGPIHRLITIGTPHEGTEWGQLAFSPLASLIASKLSIGRAYNEALTGLAPGGAAYQRLGSTTIAGGTHAIGTTWPPDASPGHALVSQWLDVLAPAETLETFFCEDASDLIASASSQLARRDARSGGTLIDGGDDFAIVAALDALLNEAQTPSRLPTTFGAPIPRACPASAAAAGAAEAAIVPAAAIAITSPAAGQVIQDDRSRPLTLTATISSPVVSLIFVVEGVGAVVAAPGTTTATLTIGGDVRLGPTTVSAIARTAAGELVSRQVPVTIVRGDQPIDLSVTPAAIALSDLNRVRRLTVVGIYTSAATVTRDLTSPALGTSYTLVSGDGIVDLTATGVITARASGSAAIDVRHGALVKRVNVTVACPAGPCLFVSPSTALATGGSVMRLYGGGFVPGTTIGVGGIPVPSNQVSVIDEHTLEFIAPAAASLIAPAGGSADLIVTIPSASSASSSTQAPSIGVLPSAVRYVAASASSDPALDSDLDGMPDRWEAQFGLHVLSADGDQDLDGDGVSNAAEFAAGTHPNAVKANTRYLAEGATGAFFNTSLALFNPGPAHATAALRFSTNTGAAARHVILVPAGTRRTIDTRTIAGLANTSFSTVIESDEPIVVDRTMTWGGGYGSHADTAVITPSPFWFLAEGSTSGDFQLFYLFQNPSDANVSATVRYLLPPGQPPIERIYTLPPNSRTTIPVDGEAPALAATDVSAAISATAPIIVERAMYRSSPAQTFAAGHESAGVTSPATRWFLAEGATGPFFDLFILIANPNASAADVRVDYLLSTGETHSKIYTLAANSRFTIWVDDEQLPEGSGTRPLANVAVSSTITSRNHVPIVVERTMWWPGVETRAAVSGEFWTEAHNSPGATETGTAWALAEGEVGGPLAAETYILIANTSDTSDTSGRVTVTLHFEDGTTASRTFDLMPRSRKTVQVSVDFPEAMGRKFATVVRGTSQLVVERAIYTSVNGETWAGGTNAMGTRIH